MDQSISKFKDIHRGERCFVLGNGPSLTDEVIDLIKYETTFGTNRIYLKDFNPTYYTCVNELVLSQFFGDILREMVYSTCFLPTNKLDKIVFESPLFNPIDTSMQFPSFSSPEGPIWEGHTVTYVALQLAYYMGFSEIVLLGVDHDFGRFSRMQPDMEIISTGPDEAHHDPEYFGKGVRWHTPNLLMSELAYTLAKQAFEDDGRRIINCSGYTKLEVFEVVSLNYLISRVDWHPRVSAIVSAYKAERFMPGLLDDLYAQTLKGKPEDRYKDKDGLEVVIVCQRGSPEYHIACEHGCDRIVITDDIPTVYKAWNLGVEAARGKYLTNANTDDRHHPKAYEVMANVLDARPNIDLVYHDSFITWEPNQTFQEFLDEGHNWEDLVTYVEEDSPGLWKWPEYSKGQLGEGCFVGPQPMWRANLHQKHGLFLDHFVSAGDFEFWLRIAKSDNMYHIPYVLGLYLARLDSIEHTNTTQGQQEASDALALHQENNVTIDPLGDEMLRLATPYGWTFIQKKPFVEQLESM